MPSQPIGNPLVDNARALTDLVGRLADTKVLALDTEFVRERTYYPELCVLQVASDEAVAAVDCLADIGLDSLFDVLLEKDRTWLLHSARQDLEVVFHRAGRLPGRLLDTQIAAALLGYPLQIGLKALLEQVLGVAIGKEHTRADWSRRPLPEAVVGYALDDVRYLMPAWRELEGRLAALGRRAWFEEECGRQLALPIEPDDASILERTKGAGALGRASRAAALALIGWRERRARDRNKPRRWILDDDNLVAIANALPETLADLRRVPGLPLKLVARSGEALIAAVGDAGPAADLPATAAPDRSLVKSLQAEIKARADALGIQPEMLATRREIGLAAAGQMPESFVSGWRGSILGDLKPELGRDRAS